MQTLSSIKDVMNKKTIYIIHPTEQAALILESQSKDFKKEY